MKIKEIILSLAIVVVLNLFFNYGVFTFYESPDYEKFCPVELTQKLYADKSECEAVGGRWFEGTGEVKYYPSEPRPIPVEPAADQQKGWCDSTAECRESYESVREVYNRNVFVVLVVLGLVSLGLGFLAISAPAVANGFLGGGLLSLIIGSIRYWSEMNDYLRFIILGVALAALIWLGYKKIATRD
ncbi:MAG: hypothetical protein AAB476_02750 [Patescibacteria group bacterium]